jgi:hypothetical protein
MMVRTARRPTASLRGAGSGERGAATRNRMEARETFRHRVFG